MKSHPQHLDPLTGNRLTQTLKEVKPSSTGLDGWSLAELVALSKWYPIMFSHLASLLNLIEEIGEWPTSLVTGYTTMLPKPDGPAVPGPMDMRPISVLPHIYRLYSKTRFKDSISWQAHWIHERAFGGVPKRSAETLAFQVALAVEAAHSQSKLAGGISYDFAKAFDVIPVNVMLDTLHARGASCRLLNSMKGVYSQLSRTYRIQGSFSEFWRASNGIIQGCSLSLLGLNSLIAAILEKADSIPRCLIGRAYADDISGECSAEDPAELLQQTKNFHDIVTSYQQCGLGDISMKKTFTFGDQSLRQAVDPQIEHVNDFRLVGVSVVSQVLTGSFTKLEQKRLDKWKNTIAKVRCLPLSWPEKAKTLLSTQSQATWGQGAHQLPNDIKALNLVRSSLMRTFYNADFYSMSPLLTFALLVPVQLEPSFAMQYAGLLTFQRCISGCAQSARLAQQILTSGAANTVGPCARIQELADGPLSEPIQQLLLNQIDNLELWKHYLREQWRQNLLRQLEKERSHQYQHATKIDRNMTMMFHDMLQQVADGTGHPGLQLTPEEAWMKLAVLRRMLAGGLLTQSRIRRHRRHNEIHVCECGLGEESTVEHVSWRCKHFDHIPQPMLLQLNPHIQNLPVVTRYAAVALRDTLLTQDEVILLQSTLVQIWQSHIERFYGEDNDPPPNDPDVGVSSDNPEPPKNANGHSLAFKADGIGVFCQKCGKHVTNLGHIKLKITGKRCEFEHVSPSQYVDQPGKHNNQNRLQKAFQDMNEKYNKGNHVLEWNYKVGKKPPDEGILNCTACGRTWKWKDRVNNLPKTVCKPITIDNNISLQKSASSSAVEPVVRRRLRGKQTISQASPSASSNLTPETLHSPSVAATESVPRKDLFFRTGIG